MGYVRKLAWLLLLGVVSMLITTGAISSESLGSAARRAAALRPVRRGRGGFLDSGPKMAETRRKLANLWRNRVIRERIRRRLDLRTPAPTAGRPRQRRPLVDGPAPGEYVYFPSGAVDDGRFLTIAGTTGSATLATEIKVKLAAPSTAGTLEIGIFDGDTSGLWDQGTGALEYTLYEDKDGNASGTTQVGQWSGSAMSDNTWFSTSISTGPGAQAPSGNYFYYLRVRLVDTTSITLSSFKIRTNASVRLEPQNSFNVIAPVSSEAAAQIIYPDWPSLTPTTYDGSWNFYAYVPNSTTFFDVWDGDLDFGTYNGSVKDTDDQNTTTIPAWATGTPANLDGASSGLNASSGNPPDDDTHAVFRRSPDVVYDVTDPNGIRYFNGNPSGNLEWENFRIDTAPFNASNMDYHADELPPGVYEVHIDGLDINNLDAFRFDFDLLGVDKDGNPVRPLLPYIVGDTVWIDQVADNAFGGLGSGEGHANVTVELLDANGFTLDTTTTDAQGQYSFPVEAGTFTVYVSPANFLPTGPLAGYRNIAGGSNTLTYTVVNANVDTYDFGYRAEGPDRLGDRVWLDVDGDMTQDSDEPGIGGVTVILRDNGGVQLTTTVTNANGTYLFTGLAAATYQVQVDTTTLPPGLTQTHDLDGTGTAHLATGALVGGTEKLDFDFGYRGTASIGDRVWNDVNNSGVQDSDDLGIGGVKLVLTGDFNGDGTADLTATDTTDSTGAYLFDRLPSLDTGTYPGAKYTVKVDTNTLPYGLTLISDPDDSPSVATPNRSEVTSLSVGQANLVQDFGYRGGGCLGGTLWKDDDQDGKIDTGETVFSNITVTLSGDLNLDGVFGEYATSQLTDADGKYSFTNLPGGRFKIVVTASQLPSGATWSPTYDVDGTGTASEATLMLHSRVCRTDIDFGYRATATVTGLAGTVWHDTGVDGILDPGEDGIPNVTVSISGPTSASMQTDADGKYSFLGIPAGTYTVTVTHAEVPTAYNTPTGDYDGLGTQNTASVAVPAGTTVQPVNFGYVGVCNLGNRVWDDLDFDGIQDTAEFGTGTEPGISGVTVQLYSATTLTFIASTPTDSNGNYQFQNLLPGAYYVKFIAPSVNHVFSPSLEGSNRAVDSDPDTVTGESGVVTLTEGTTNLTVDCGFYDISKGQSVGDLVWIDANANGVQDAGEAGVAGVTVELYRQSTGALLQTTVTNSDGNYLFTGVGVGRHYVKFYLPNGFAFTQALQGGDTTKDSNANASTGITAEFQVNGGNDVFTIDCGLLSPMIEGCVWYDQNRDGVFQYTESGLGGVTVQLYSGATLLKTTTTSGGAFTFTGVAAGVYTVKVVTSSLPADKTIATVDSDDIQPPLLTPHEVIVDVEALPTGTDGSVFVGPKACFGYSVAPRLNTASNYRSQTQGGWGAEPRGGNAGGFLHANWTTVYPTGTLVVGKEAGASGSFWNIFLNGAQAVTNFLPQGGTASVLTQNHTNPLSTEAGVLAAQLVTAQISRDFSAAGVTKSGLGSLKLTNPPNASNPFKGYSLDKILVVGNRVLSGNLNALPNGATITHLNEALDYLNNCFVDGIEDKGYYR